MMEEKKNMKIIYIDACVYIGIAMGETSTIPRDYWGRIYDFVKKGSIKIIASNLLLDEVQYTRSKDVTDQLGDILRQKDLVICLGVNDTIKEGALNIVEKSRKYNEREKSTMIHYSDAIHLQTALSFGAQEFHTTDKSILGLNREVYGGAGMQISRPQESEFYISASS